MVKCERLRRLKFISLGGSKVGSKGVSNGVSNGVSKVRSTCRFKRVLVQARGQDRVKGLV